MVENYEFLTFRQFFKTFWTSTTPRETYDSFGLSDDPESENHYQRLVHKTAHRWGSNFSSDSCADNKGICQYCWIYLNYCKYWGMLLKCKQIPHKIEACHWPSDHVGFAKLC